MTVHKCFKCEKIYDCTNEAVMQCNKDFFAELFGFEGEKDLLAKGYDYKDPICNEEYDATCPFCAFKIIFNREYEPKL